MKLPHVVGLVSVLAFACESAPAPPHSAVEVVLPVADTMHSGGSPAKPPAPVSAPLPTATPQHSSVTLVYGRMTNVMDSPTGQQAKALAALQSSALVRHIVAPGHLVNYRFDATLAGNVTVLDAAGREIWGGELDEATSRAPAEALINKIDAALKL
jgi:hypothetical protein